LPKDTTSKDTSIVASQFEQDYPLFMVLRPNAGRDNQLMPGSVVGYSHFKDTAKVDAYLNLKQVRALLPRDIKFLWSVKP